MAVRTITDRRKNPSGKALPNRQRFLNRSRKQVKKYIEEKILKRSVSDEGDETVSIPTDGIHEPHFRHTRGTGSRDIVIPGNKEFTPGDLIEKPQGGAGAGGNGDASDTGDGIDEFDFLISSEEYHDMLFEDLDLPNLQKQSLNQIIHTESKRVGFATEGTPNNLDLLKSMSKALSRKIALKNPKLKRIQKLREELECLESKNLLSSEEEERILEIKAEISALIIRANAISFIDPIDLRYRNYLTIPKPNFQAVMFCVMDVSGSVTQKEKDLSKRFYILLHLFLRMKYKIVDVVFIRHHTVAKEVGEEEFFYSRETGGTIVSTGFELMHKIQKERYPDVDWNIYVAQASDGDNFNHDTLHLLKVLEDKILPIVQYFAYIEVNDNPLAHCALLNPMGYVADTTLWKTYNKIKSKYFQMRHITTKEDIFPVFRDLFAKEKAK